ncbi:hypothetical protein JCM11491_004088 [Sporobolomyces phaffii]
MTLYACGSNEHRQIHQQAPLHVVPPFQLKDFPHVVAASWSQVVLRDAKGKASARGLPLENSFTNLSAAVTWLGQDEFVAVLLDDGRIQRLGDKATTSSRYSQASINSRGEVVVVPRSSLSFSLPACRHPVKLELPFYPSSSSAVEHVSSISCGAAHFLILASPSARVFSIGDNRYGQLGVPHASASSSKPVLHHVDLFDGLRVSSVSAGAFHSVALTESGQVYLFGSDERGQCGGSGGGSEPTLDETLEALGEAEGDDNEIVQACAFGESTVVRTRRGQVWVAGSSTHTWSLHLTSHVDESAPFDLRRD